MQQESSHPDHPGTADAEWIPSGVDVDKPSAARAYDALLGGAHNFAVDRLFARKAKQVFPGVDAACRANREFLRRAVTHAAQQGIRQFLDIGSGIPTVGNVHEIAQSVAPDSRVVYVDNEPVAVAHSELILRDHKHAHIHSGDVREPEQVLAEAARYLDFDQPIMVLMLALLHFVPDTDDPAGLVTQYRRALSPGSALALTHATAAARPEEMRDLEALYATSSNPAVARSPEWITELFGDYALVDPGTVYVPEWRPDTDTPHQPEDYIFFGGLGLKLPSSASIAED